MKNITNLVLTIIVCVVFSQNLNARVNRELKMETSIISKDEKETKQCEIIRKHSFSREDREDTFKLIFNCENLEDSMSFQSKKRMDEFFNDDRFIVNPVMKLDKKHLNVFHYDGISGDSTVIGFKIQLFVEGFEMIAYSKKMQKVQFIASAD
jgi:hypothetical protein